MNMVPALPLLPDEVRVQLEALGAVSRETIDKLRIYGEMLIEETAQQNLISASTIPDFWTRHILDSAQLIAAAGHPKPGVHWLDIGSGAGLPGIVLAIFGCPVTMIEPRRLRVDFLLRVIDQLQLDHATALCGKVENLPKDSCFDVITARAVAPLNDLWRMAGHVAKDDTIWTLPKGKNAINELELARRSWQGDFTIIPSVTSADARIIVARHVRPRNRGNTRP